MCPISFVCMYLCEQTHLPPQSALDPERLIVRTEMRGRPYLVLVETRPYFIISRFHALRPISSISRVLWCREALIHTEDGRGQDARESENGWVERYWTYFCNFLLPIPPGPLYHSSPFSQPAAWKRLVTFIPHYLKTKWELRWHFKAGIQIEVSLVMGNYCVQTFSPNLMSHCTSKQQLWWSWDCNNKASHASLNTWTTCGAALCWKAL